MRVFRRVMLGGGIDIDAIPDTQKLYYKATAKVAPNSNSLGAPLIANKWDSTTGEGIIVCSRDIETIKSYGFYGKSDLKKITIPFYITSIGVEAFGNCTLDEMVLQTPFVSKHYTEAITSGPAGVTYSYTNDWIKKVSISKLILEPYPESIGSTLHIGDFAFAESNIQNVDVSAATLGKGVFKRSKVQKISFTAITPFSPLRIPEHCCNGCNSLKEITINANANNIGYRAFFNCVNLEKLVVKSNLKSLIQGGEVFSYAGKNTTLGIYLYNNTLADYMSNPLAFYSEQNHTIHLYIDDVLLQDVIIPDSVTGISACTFMHMSITSVTIPSSVAFIGTHAFSDCATMQYYDFSAHKSVPTLDDIDAFNNIPSTCKIIVPDALYDEWIAATNWSTYASYIIKKSDWDASQTTE